MIATVAYMCTFIMHFKYVHLFIHIFPYQIITPVQKFLFQFKKFDTAQRTGESHKLHGPIPPGPVLEKERSDTYMYASMYMLLILALIGIPCMSTYRYKMYRRVVQENWYTLCDGDGGFLFVGSEHKSDSPSLCTLLLDLCRDENAKICQQSLKLLAKMHFIEIDTFDHAVKVLKRNCETLS